MKCRAPALAGVAALCLLLAACPSKRGGEKKGGGGGGPAKQVKAPPAKAPDIPSRGPLAQKIYYEQAKGLLQGGRLEPAVESFRRAISAHEGGKLAANCYLGLGSALGELGQKAASVEAYRKVVALLPQDPGAYRALAIGLEDLGKLDEAASSLRQSLELDPDQLTAYQDLASLFLRQKDHAKAQQAFVAYEQRRARLIKVLGLSKEVEQRESAAAILGQARDESTARALGLALADNEKRVRLAVIRALGQQGLKSGAGPLKDRKRNTRDVDELKAIQFSLESIEAAVQPAPAPAPAPAGKPAATPPAPPPTPSPPAQGP